MPRHLILTITSLLALVGFLPGQQGRISAWGDDTAGQVSQAPLGFLFDQVEGGSGWGIALKSDGSV